MQIVCLVMFQTCNVPIYSDYLLTSLSIDQEKYIVLSIGEIGSVISLPWMGDPPDMAVGSLFA